LQLGLRGRLFLVFIFVIASIVLTGAIVFHGLLERSFDRQTEQELDHETALLSQYLSKEPWPMNVAAADSFADELGGLLGCRVTLMTTDGRVLGDSELSVPQVEAIENHRGRPEVQEALRNGSGSATRFSTTLDQDLVYVAKLFRSGGAEGIVRAARPLAQVRRAAAPLYALFAFAGAVGLAIAIAVASWSSRSFSNALHLIIDYVEHAQDGATRAPFSGRRDEIGGLATSVQRLVEKLQEQVSELASERHRFEDLLEGMTEALIALDEHRRVTLVNRAALGLLGEETPPLGRTILELIRVPELNALLNNLERGGTTTSEFYFGASPSRRVLARAKRRATGDFVVVLLDVTELRRLENVRRDFVANVSHELRTPVSILKATTETLIDGAIDEPEAARRFLSTIAVHSERLTNLISDLLDISRLEEGKYALDNQVVTVDSAFRRAIAALGIQAEAKAMALRVEVNRDLKVVCDLRALDQVLFNLVENAIKYAPKGSEITLRAAHAADCVVLEVADDGPGIEPRHRERLFERFYRVDPGRSREMGGTGLGLAIVKHLVVSMGGKVGMRPASPHGAIFWVSLPEKAA
jgi:two-component system, OmpR family, phosphate regulon sensor histidine kinase PhoR